jgi:hypothetical protein
MTDEEKVVEEEQPEGQKATVTEEIKVQTQDLFKAINDLVREGTVRRVTVLRNDRVLLDIPLILGVPASIVLATQMPVITAVAGVACSQQARCHCSPMVLRPRGTVDSPLVLRNRRLHPSTRIVKI